MRTSRGNGTEGEKGSPNLPLLILLLLLVQLTVGCSGRKGPFLQLGGGIAPIYANQEWISTEIKSGKIIDRSHHDSTVIAVSPVGNFKLGWGITEQLLVSPSFQMSKLSSLGWGITVFHKKNAPSLFFRYSFFLLLYIFRSGFLYLRVSMGAVSVPLSVMSSRKT